MLIARITVKLNCLKDCGHTNSDNGKRMDTSSELPHADSKDHSKAQFSQGLWLYK